MNAVPRPKLCDQASVLVRTLAAAESRSETDVIEEGLALLSFLCTACDAPDCRSTPQSRWLIVHRAMEALNDALAKEGGGA